jgi:phosphate/sulfate permease
MSPILSLLLAGGLFYLFRAYFRKVRRERSNLFLVYLLVYILAFVTLISVFTKILNWGTFEAIFFSFLAALIFPTLSAYAFRRKYGKFEAMQSMNYLLVVVLCFSAFAFGANDMANATGVFITPTQNLMGAQPESRVMLLLASIGALGVAIGGLTWGYKVINTAAYQVTRLDPLSGAAAEYSNAITVFLFTVVPTFLIGFGMPISTTHSSIGSIIGVGLAMRGLTGISKRTTGKILAFWILTIPCVALISMSLFWLFSHVMVI